MISPSLFALVHLAIVLVVCIALALSAMPSRMARGRHRGITYRRLSTEEMLKRVKRLKP